MQRIKSEAECQAENQAKKRILIQQIYVAADHLLEDDADGMIDSAVDVIFELCKLYKEKE